ncbi:MAG TPA: RNA polymerase sigma factor, partial [Holophaga sp.]|nr:RNA polymerase sigma factor [Holophaga sp.]
PMMPVPPPSFEALHAEYRSKVHSYLCRFVEPAEAEDLTQEVFLKVHQNLATFRQECRLSTWIFQIATHAALDRLKRPARRLIDQRSLRIEKLDESGLHALPDHGNVPLHEEMCRCIQDFVGGLPANYGAILFLSDLKELRLEEIAQVLGITPGAAKIRLHRARQALKARMELGCRISLDERGELSCDRK